MEATRNAAIVSVLFIALILRAPSALAQDPTPQEEADLSSERDAVARQHFEWGTRAYERGDFTTAVTEFQEAYRLSGRPQLLYNLYIAHRDARQNQDAAETLRHYLELVPNAGNRAQLESRLRALDEENASRQAEVEPTPTEPTPTAPVEEDDTPAPPASEETEGGPSLVPWIVVGSGAALLVGGTITGILTLSDAGDLEDGCTNGRCPSRLRDTHDSAGTLATVTDVLFIGGGLVAAAGVALFFVMDDDEEAPPTASAFCGPTGCVATVRGEFE